MQDGTSVEAQRSSVLGNVVLLAISLVVSVVVLEAGYRFAAGLPLFKIVDWRTDQVSTNRFGDRAVFDPVLGWRTKPRSSIDSFTTIDYGIRKNFDETTVRTGGILAVGDSFTEGWEVEDDESWPAVLEQKVGAPVVNAGIGGYGTDQIILRAEQMLPIVKPKILIIGFLHHDIYRSGHSIFGAPKPWFSLEGGALRFHPPQPLEPRPPGILSSLSYGVRDALGYLAMADYVLARLNPGYWYSTESKVEDQRVPIDPAEVTCALLRRVKEQTDKDGIRTMLFMQYYAKVLIESYSPPPDAKRVMDCARQSGIRVVDQFAPLRRLVMTGPQVMKDYYMYSGAVYGHMSPKGNQHAAEMLADALRDWLQSLAAAK